MTKQGPASVPRPLRRDAQANRDRILAAAPAVLATRGPDAPMEAIAEHAGVGIGTLYRRFPTRESLLAAIVEVETGRLAEAAEAAMAQDPWDGLVGFIEYALESPVADVILKRVLLSGAPVEVLERRLLGALLPAVTALVDRARAAGVVRDDMSPTDIPLLMMAVSMIAFETRGGGSGPARRLLAIALAGFRPGSDWPLAAPPMEGPQFLRAVLAASGRGPGSEA